MLRHVMRIILIIVTVQIAHPGFMWSTSAPGLTTHDIAVLRASGADCNQDSLPDDTDIALGLSRDRNANGIPDDCEFPADERRFQLARTTLCVVAQFDSIDQLVHITYRSPVRGSRPILQIVAANGATLTTLKTHRAASTWATTVWNARSILAKVQANNGCLIRLKCDSLAVARSVPAGFYNRPLRTRRQ
jgi:hypothetical protein